MTPVIRFARRRQSNTLKLLLSRFLYVVTFHGCFIAAATAVAVTIGLYHYCYTIVTMLLLLLLLYGLYTRRTLSIDTPTAVPVRHSQRCKLLLLLTLSLILPYP